MTDRSSRPNIDFAMIRGATQRRFSRRDFLRGAGAGAGALGLSAFLAACGVSGQAPKKRSGASPADLKKIYGDGTPAGTLNFGNWEDYIDVNAKGKSPTLQKFTQQTGIEVNYTTPVTDVDPFLAKIIPVLQAGQDTGYDLAVITDGGGIERILALDLARPLDHQYLPNFAQHASDSVKNPAYDQGNKYTIAWQSGYTIIGYNKDVVDPPPTSFADLLNPKYKGRVGMFANNTDLPCPALVHLGYEVQTSTPDQWKKAAELLTKQRDDGIVKKYYHQEYIDALENHDIDICQAWSGDLFIAAAPKAYGGDGHKEVEAAIPQEGGILWTDSMFIPKYAQHPVDAIMMMDFVYRPEIAAPLADFIWYVSPVPEAKDIVLNEIDDPLVANSPLVFPTAEQLASSQRYRVFKDNAELEEWNSIFQPIYSS
ncbi:MAG TPA: spermidine/putrescine ABC transporter substrate-binding protein [Actinomycetota bacterium]|nr:spermidine/putrescine ABC transporter substrate-binding protein [Actinomycetota bacterium]